MAAITDIDVFDVVPALGVKKIIVQTRNTVDAGDTVAVTLADYGISDFIGIMGWKHTTDGSVVVTEAPTTAVVAGVLTITVIAGTDDDTRIWEITGYSKGAKYA